MRPQLSASEGNEHYRKAGYVTADAIGGDIIPERVVQLIEEANFQGMAFHGIKTEDGFRKANISGIEPLTPEGREKFDSDGVSFWTSGFRLFYSEGDWPTYDTTFFHWSSIQDRKPGQNSNVIALTRRGDLLDRDMKRSASEITEDGYITLPDAIPRDAICILRVNVYAGGTEYEPRRYGQIAEQRMFQLLERVIIDGEYQPGGEIIEEVHLGADELLAT